jgi:RNA polymerase sigma-70 factor (ECF subfamily)
MVDEASPAPPKLPVDRNHFERLLHPILGVAYGTALKLTGNRDDAMDLVQDATLQAFRFFGTFEPGTNFKAWFFKILTNRFLKGRIRAAKQSLCVPLEDAEDLFMYVQTGRSGLHTAEDPASLLMDRLDSEAVQEAIDRLPEEFRVVSILYFLNDFKYEDIAEVVDCPVGTVRSRLHRGRKLLQRALWELAVARGIVAEVQSEVNGRG